MSGELFKDPQFRHEWASIQNPDPESKKHIELKKETLLWKPGRELRKDDIDRPWRLFNGISPQDLVQGGLGDCWLIAAIACLAEFPNEVRQIFLRPSFKDGDEVPLPEDGRYELELYDYKKGEMREVTVDEYVPCHWKEGHPYEPCFAKPRGNELWCVILEKAFAKLFGGFSELKGGMTTTAWRALTGVKEQLMWEREQPGSSLWEKHEFDPTGLGSRRCATAAILSAKEMFRKLQEHDQQNFMQACSFRPEFQGGKKTTRGLTSGHAYSILQVLKISDHSRSGDGKPLKLVQLRNPWGRGMEWDDAWSDTSSKWNEHPDVKRQLRPVDSKDGIFWMCFEDFADHFDKVYVCPKAMREGNEAEAHAAASRNWKHFKFDAVLALRVVSAFKGKVAPANAFRRLSLEAVRKAGEGLPGRGSPGALEGENARLLAEVTRLQKTCASATSTALAPGQGGEETLEEENARLRAELVRIQQSLDSWSSTAALAVGHAKASAVAIAQEAERLQKWLGDVREAEWKRASSRRLDVRSAILQETTPILSYGEMAGYDNEMVVGARTSGKQQVFEKAGLRSRSIDNSEDRRTSPPQNSDDQVEYEAEMSAPPQNDHSSSDGQMEYKGREGEMSAPSPQEGGRPGRRVYPMVFVEC